MAQRRFHYEQAFEHYLRANRVPYVAVDEAKKALLPAGRDADRTLRSIKSFDFVVYGPDCNRLIDVKGRMAGRASTGSAGGSAGCTFQSWVTREDIDGLTRWQELFGTDFRAVFVFLYCLRRQPPDALFEEIFEYGGRWYALRETALADYCAAMRPRSARWGTVYVPAEEFRRISRPLRLRAAPTVAP